MSEDTLIRKVDAALVLIEECKEQLASAGGFSPTSELANAVDSLAITAAESHQMVMIPGEGLWLLK